MDTHGAPDAHGTSCREDGAYRSYDVGKLTVPVGRTAPADFKERNRLPSWVRQSDATIPAQPEGLQRTHTTTLSDHRASGARHPNRVLIFHHMPTRRTLCGSRYRSKPSTAYCVRTRKVLSGSAGSAAISPQAEASSAENAKAKPNPPGLSNPR
jgi:hypothetical protein